MLYIENHDHPRMVSRYGSEKFQKESAKMLAVSYLFQKGTPFIYQGQEIGMTNWYPSDPEMYEDVQTRWQYFNVATNKSPEKRLEEKDTKRKVNYKYFTGRVWGSVENYHISLDSGALTPEKCVDIIVGIAK